MRTAHARLLLCLAYSLTLVACSDDAGPGVDAGPADAGPPLSNDLETLNQLGVVVEDVDAVSERWEQVLGIGPWVMKDHSGKNAQGKPFTARFAYATVGELELELVEITSGETPQTDFVDETGEGLYHLGFFVDDVDRRAAQLVEGGAEIVLQQAGEWAYVDSPGSGGALLKLIERREPLAIDAGDAGTFSDAFVLNVISHVGLVVEDLDATSLHWERTFGVADWTLTFGFMLTSNDGKSAEADIGFHPLGAAELELVQVKTSTLPEELTDLGPDGEGLFEIAVNVSDLQGALTKLKDSGARVVLEAPTVAFVDIGGGVLVELLLQ